MLGLSLDVRGWAVFFFACTWSRQWPSTAPPSTCPQKVTVIVLRLGDTLKMDEGIYRVGPFT